MKHTTSTAVACLLLLLSSSCAGKKENQQALSNEDEKRAIALASDGQQAQSLQFPYQEYVSYDDEGLLVIGNDGNGFAAISHRIRYPKVPDTMKLTPFADSLLQCYNITLAYNTLAYDSGTANLYTDEENPLGEEQANALDSINVSGISDITIRNAIIAVGHEAAKDIRYYIRNKKHSDMQGLDDAVAAFYEAFESLNAPLFDAHLPETTIIYDPSTVIKNYESIHEKALTDTLHYRNELLQQVLNEKDFQKACVLAREFAYANHKSEDRNDEELVAVLDKLIREGQYSPLLNELWLMWRTALQSIWGGASNYSSMYNLFYNDMRNRVALTYIAYLNDHPQDKLAFQEFAELFMRHNITRNSECLIGNNVLLDEMELYQHLW